MMVLTIRVYQYGCLSPTVFPEEAEQQLRLANRLWNALVANDRHAQEQNTTLWSEQNPIRILEEEIANLDHRITELRTQTANTKKSTRKATVAPERREEISVIVAQRKDLRQQLRETKVSLKDNIKDQQSSIWETQKQADKNARQQFASQGLYWGIYNDTMQHFQVASKKAHQTGGTVRFRRYTGEGTWTVQIQTMSGTAPATVEDLFNPSSRIRNLVQVDRVDTRNWEQLPRWQRKQQSHTMLHMRVTSNGREAIMIDLPMIMHRPIPEGASIKLVRLTRKKLGRQWKYAVSFTVDEPVSVLPAPTQSAVAVDLGWRKVDNRLRVGVWVGDQAPYREHEISLPERLIGGFEQADRIRSYRDTYFNEAISALRAWLTDNPECPEWLRDLTAYIAQWKSHERLMNVVETWKQLRFSTDRDIFEQLSEWRKKERHLQDFEVNLRDRLVKWRREIYRVEASKLAKQFRTIILEDMNLQNLSRTPRIENGDTQQERIVRAHRTLASPGVLREALLAAFRDSEHEVVLATPVNTTRIHASCGHIVEADYASSVQIQCPSCNVWYDQDANACRNLLGVPEPEMALN